MADTTHVLEVSITELHNESRQWLSSIEFWKDELNFFQKLLDNNFLSIPAGEKMKQLEHLQNRIIYYRDEVVDEYRHNVKEHESNLASIQQSEREDEQSYRKQHAKLKEELTTLTGQFRDFKKELFQFVEGLK